MAKEPEERKLPEILEIPFVICDNSVNRHKWRLLVEGIDLSGFLKNPVCCVQHNTWMIPVGKWKDLRVEGEQLRGKVEFDRNDPEAVRLFWKYKDGYMNAVSLNIIPVEESDDAKLLLPGQKYKTVTKSEMLEISLVTVPGQKNAVRLSTPEGNEYQLNLVTNNQSKKMEKDEKTIEQLQTELTAQRKLNAENLVKIHKQRGVVADGEMEHLQKLALADYESVSKMLDARPDPQPEKTEKETTEAEKQLTVTEELKCFAQSISSGNAKPTDERSGWKYLDFYKKDPDALVKMQKDEPEKYKKLEADFYAESEKMGIQTTSQE